ncbi:hypothetical protein [Sphingomonas olei]|jgi:hypothetical protein|uniref:TetR family transcriptional regulator n=1 Tax=Sphingomonas olei TaxID=1886787 RepID=A0ABY2QED7_9SPHN|nr:hypothetical protein [Sphingomonas olei]THG37250.1 hypothetical protein E5988_16060 [Sphingomonas olei]
MKNFPLVTAVAVIGDAAVRPLRARTQRAVAVAAVTSRIENGTIAFALSSHVVRSAAALQHWLDDAIADDPVLVGHRLLRISRLLCASGFDRNLAHSFQPEGRHDIADLHRNRLTPLVVSALYADVLAVDEQALTWSPRGRRDGHTLAMLAVINALATWVIFFRRASAGPENAVTREKVLTRLVEDLRRGGAPGALVGSVAPSIH